MKRTIIEIISLGALLCLSAGNALGATNTQVILTWEAQNFFPANFSGKAFPTTGTRVIVSAEILQNNTLLDIGRAQFTWYVDEKVTTQGVGIKETSFLTTKLGGDYHFVRVIIDLNGQTFETSTRIPVHDPLVVIESRYPQNVIGAGAQVALQATPYFFNISSLRDLSFSWQINDVKKGGGGDNALLINVGTPQNDSQRILQITSYVNSLKNALEFTTGKLRLEIH